MKEILINPHLPIYLWLSAIIAFIFNIIVVYKKNKLLKQVIEIKDNPEFYKSITTGLIPEEFLDKLDSITIRIIRKIYVLRLQIKVLLAIFLFIFYVIITRYLLLKI